jgi:hypothetical protein
MSGSRRGAWGAMLVCSFTAGVAAAQSGEDPTADAEAAEAEFERGWQLLEAGEWGASCAAFEKSMQLERAVATLLRVAHCHEHEGKLATAWSAFQDALVLNRDSTLDEARRAELEAYTRLELDKLEPRVPRLVVQVVTPRRGAEVTLDGTAMVAEKLDEPILVDPGKHVLEAAAPGYRAARATVTAREGVLLEVPFELVALSAEPEPARRARAPVAVKEEGDTTQRTAGLVTGAVGLTSLGVAAALGFYTLLEVDESSEYCNDDDFCTSEGIELREDAARAQTAGFVMLGIGALALATGAVVYFTAPPPNDLRHGPPKSGARLVVAGAAARIEVAF